MLVGALHHTLPGQVVRRKKIILVQIVDFNVKRLHYQFCVKKCKTIINGHPKIVENFVFMRKKGKLTYTSIFVEIIEFII